MQYLLATHGLILVLNSLAHPSPNAVDDVHRAKYNLEGSKGEGLTCHKFKDISSSILFNCQVDGRYEQIEEIMEDNCSHDDEHRSLGVGIGESHL